MTEILFLRHGESLGNSEKIFAGHFDFDLSPRGYLQAEAAADFLANENINAIYSSDLKRAYNTAKAVSCKVGVPIYCASQKLREIYIGDYEGAHREEIIRRYDCDFMKYYTSAFGVYHFPKGESTFGAGQRFFAEVSRIAVEHQGQQILIATHAGVLRSFWGIISNIPKESVGNLIPFATNASVSKVVFDDFCFTPVYYSQCEHLKSIGFIDYTKDVREL